MNSFFDEEAKTKFHRSNVEMDSLIATKVKNRVAKFEIRSGYRRKSLTYLSSTYLSHKNRNYFILISQPVIHTKTSFWATYATISKQSDQSLQFSVSEIWGLETLTKKNILLHSLSTYLLKMSGEKRLVF